MENDSKFIIELNLELEEIVQQYSTITVTKIANIFNVNMNAKNGFNLLFKKIIGASNAQILDQLVSNDDLVFKTIRLDKYGQLKESISLPVFKYTDIVQESWEISKLRNYFITTVFAFVVFKAEDKNQFLNRIVIWKMPTEVLENSVKYVWQKMHENLNDGQIVKYIDDNGRYFSYFPSSSETPYVHVRPHAKNRLDTLPLPVPDRLTGFEKYPKHSFWINRNYVLKIIQKDIR